MTEAELSPEVRLLILAANDAAMIAAEKGDRTLPIGSHVTDRATPLCKFLSEDPITAGETARIGLPTIRQWKQCAKGYGVQGSDGNGYICGCMPWPKGGCDGCPDYVAGDVI